MFGLSKAALLTTAAAISFTAGAATTPELPAPVRALQQQGLQIVGSFAAPAGMTGFAAQANGRPLTIYVTADGDYALVGPMIDKDGNNLSTLPVRQLITDPQNKAVWDAVEKDSHWIQDGAADAPHIIYMFDDPECPYCHRFWQAARPWVDAGKVQIRHIMVGIITARSPAESAALLAAGDPAAALLQHEQAYHGEGKSEIDVSAATSAARQQVTANESLMRRFGIRGTPALYYQRADGGFGSVGGMPQPEQMEEVMGGPRPDS